MVEFLLSEGPMTWVFTGDSITQGVFHTHGGRSWVEHVHERVRWQLDRLRDVVINTGMSGWTTPQVLGEFDSLVARFEPSVVSLSLGMNDVQAGSRGREDFRDSIRRLVLASRELGAQVVLHTPTLASSDAPGRADLPAYADIVRTVAAEEQTVLVDHAKDWTANFGQGEPDEWLDDDPCHPNAAGHLRMADLTLRTFGLGGLEDRL